MNEDWKNWEEPAKTSVVVWRSKVGSVRAFTRFKGSWCFGQINLTWPELLTHIDMYGDGTPPRIVKLDELEPEPATKRVVVWRSGDLLDKLKPYVGREGVEVRAERDGTVAVGPLGSVTSTGRFYVAVGALTLSASRWDITVTAQRPLAPWWLVDRIEEDHVVSWTEWAGLRATAWGSASDLAKWRSNWDKFADPDSWRVTDVHAAGGPKLIAGKAVTTTTEEEKA